MQRNELVYQIYDNRTHYKFCETLFQCRQYTENEHVTNDGNDDVYICYINSFFYEMRFIYKCCNTAALLKN